MATQTHHMQRVSLASANVDIRDSSTAFLPPLTPPRPKQTRWQCHVCFRTYPLGVTSRCLSCGHRFCGVTLPRRNLFASGEKKRTKKTEDDNEKAVVRWRRKMRQGKCGLRFDQVGWGKHQVWKWERAGLQSDWKAYGIEFLREMGEVRLELAGQIELDGIHIHQGESDGTRYWQVTLSNDHENSHEAHHLTNPLDQALHSHPPSPPSNQPILATLLTLGTSIQGDTFRRHVINLVRTRRKQRLRDARLDRFESWTHDCEMDCVFPGQCWRVREALWASIDVEVEHDAALEGVSRRRTEGEEADNGLVHR